ncbi:uncharacterized protein LOC118410631 isoform X1 [Branchiostoma floridae]|uniref:Uncharacterized protein LOC118410631 isoform X1 n=1 Tax=Branchiostoma floridae TaxID=7739 RepID=A0A9J7KQI6_BRAFL|nr:uncharacterized protein LOC118410631 isoform X1 [Branchiostoma floridae]XP_035668306.1 uncharacterized protein LOC118410631 isoform X1 [Branchiostoma floridae]
MSSNSCHLTWKSLQQYAQDTKKLELDLPHIEEHYNETLTFLTMRYGNLRGFMLFNLDQSREAEKSFRKVLEVDPSNLNAIGNLVVLYEEQFMYAKAREMHAKLKALLKEGGNNGEARQARATAEQAFAIQWFEQDKRDFGHLAYFEEAARRSEYALPEERLAWKFQCGLAVYRLYLQFLQAKATEENILFTRCKALAYFNDAIQVYEKHRPDNSRDAALCWVFIGIIVLDTEESERHDLFNSSQVAETTPKECFDTALSLSRTPYVVRRIGEQLGRPEMKEYARALEMLDEALEQNPRRCGWFCHDRKGIIYLQMFKHKTSLEGHSPDTMLQESLKNFRKAVQFKKTYTDFDCIGQIQLELGDYQSAIAAFRQAVNHGIDDRCDPGLTHRLWAKCLEELDEFEGAEEQHFTARIVEQKLAQSMPGQPIPGLDTLRPLSAFRQVEKPRNKQGYKYDFFVSYSSKDDDWVVGVLVKTLEEKHGFKGLVHDRDFQVGKSIIDNISYGIDQSFKTILVLSENFLRSNWCRYEMQQVHLRAMKGRGDHVIAILYKPCEVPDDIAHLTYLPCKTDGQLGPDGWRRLEDALTDSDER